MVLKTVLTKYGDIRHFIYGNTLVNEAFWGKEHTQNTLWVHT